MQLFSESKHYPTHLLSTPSLLNFLLALRHTPSLPLIPQSPDSTSGSHIGKLMRNLRINSRERGGLATRRKKGLDRQVREGTSTLL
jgi:hypothetical protein